LGENETSWEAAALSRGSGAALGGFEEVRGGGRGLRGSAMLQREDADGDDLSYMMMVRQRYRTMMMERPPSTAGPDSGGLDMEWGGDQGVGATFLLNDQSVYYLMLSVEPPPPQSAGHRAGDKAPQSAGDRAGQAEPLGQKEGGLQDGHGVTMDYGAELFLSMYGAPNRLRLAIGKGGDKGRANKLLILGPQVKAPAAPPNAAVAPAFVHYNGGAKLGRWNPGVGRPALHRARLEAYDQRNVEARRKVKAREDVEAREKRAPQEARVVQAAPERLLEAGSAERSELDALFSRHVSLVDNSLRAAHATYSGLCPAAGPS